MLSKVASEVYIVGATRQHSFPKAPKMDDNVIFDFIQLKQNIDRNTYTPSDNSAESSHENKESSTQGINQVFKDFIPQRWKNWFRNMRGIILTNLQHFPNQWNTGKDHSSYIKSAISISRQKKFDIIIGIDTLGLIAAHSCEVLTQKKATLIYWSLEIEKKQQLFWWQKLLKVLEGISHRFAEFTIIQEKERGLALCYENGLNFNKTSFEYVPHGMLGFCESHSEHDYFHTKFKLPNSTKIILHAGWINDAMLSRQLSDAVGKWRQSSWKLIFHEREERSETEPYLQEIINLGKENILLSLDPVEFDQVDNLIASADIGVVLYNKKMGANCEFITKASGKMAHYLRCGIPVVCLSLPGFQKIIDTYECGVTFDSVNQIEEAIDQVLKNYDYYKQNTLRCYKDLYEFSNHFEKVLTRLDFN